MKFQQVRTLKSWPAFYSPCGKPCFWVEYGLNFPKKKLSTHIYISFIFYEGLLADGPSTGFVSNIPDVVTHEHLIVLAQVSEEFAPVLESTKYALGESALIVLVRVVRCDEGMSFFSALLASFSIKALASFGCGAWAPLDAALK